MGQAWHHPPAALHGRILVGTTSWTEKTLLTLGDFYPPDVKTAEQRLRHYAGIFPIVEVDSSFYAIPAQHNAEQWSARTAPGFVFDVKSYRLFTQHRTPVRSLPADVRQALATRDTSVYYSKLPGELQAELWRQFRAALEPLRASGRLGVVLFQFAPWLVFGKEGKQHILHCAQQMQGYRVAVELSNASWLREARQAHTLAFLRDHQLAHVVVDEPQETSFSLPAVWEATRPDIAVVRLHGRHRETWQQKVLAQASERFAGLYTDLELRSFVTPVKRLAKQASEVHVLFNNCYADYAQTNAAHFSQLLGRRACAASTSATHSVSFRAVGRCRNSFGPCALEPGPSTPVMQNCACGNFSPSMYMKGMVPPSPMDIAGLPK
jgi:uncharacterized protein YecE (DUF72 family)